MRCCVDWLTAQMIGVWFLLSDRCYLPCLIAASVSRHRDISVHAPWLILKVLSGLAPSFALFLCFKLVRKAWCPLTWFFTWDIDCDILIGWSCLIKVQSHGGCGKLIVSKTHKRLKERFLIRRNGTKHANFRCNNLFQATYNTTENSWTNLSLSVRCQEAGGRKRARDNLFSECWQSTLFQIIIFFVLVIVQV